MAATIQTMRGVTRTRRRPFPSSTTLGGRTRTPRAGTYPDTVRSPTGEREQPRFEDLVPRAIDGDHAAWESIVARLQRVVWHAIAGFDLSAADRQDAFAATFFRLSERLATVQQPQKLPGWVATTARNEVLTLLRARRRLTPTDPADMALPASPATSDDSLLDDELHRAVHSGFAALPPRCQELLRLATLDPPLSYAEIGQLLGMPHGSIGPTRQRCLDQLRSSPELRSFTED